MRMIAFLTIVVGLVVLVVHDAGSVTGTGVLEESGRPLGRSGRRVAASPNPAWSGVDADVELQPVAVPATTASREGRSFTVAATGDLTIHSAVARTARTGDGWDFRPMFSKVAGILQAADLAVCHIESPISADNEVISFYPFFSVPVQLADAIAYAGYDTCSLASNHSMDIGLSGVVGTIEALDRVGVAHSGMSRSPAESRVINLVEVNGATVAHLSYTYGLNTGELRSEDAHMVNIIDESAILEEARRARAAGADFVILSLHWGTEYRRSPDRYQSDVGRRLLSSTGVDLIIGHHVHVVQPVDRVGDEYIFYGLGNFLSNQSPRWEDGRQGTQDGVIVQFVVAEDPSTGRWLVSSVSHTPTRVQLTTFEIVNVLKPVGEYRGRTLTASAADTAEALSGLGITVRAIPGPLPDPTDWLRHLHGGATNSCCPGRPVLPQ